MRSAAVVLLLAIRLLASQHAGRVDFNGLSVPGATVTAARGTLRSTAITDAQGGYAFPDLSDGVWTLSVEMTGFAPARRQVEIGPGAPEEHWELTLLPLDRIPTVSAVAAGSAAPQPAQSAEDVATPATAAAADSDERATPGFLLNGTVNNGASSPFAQVAAFGNNRRTGRGLYNGSIGLIADNSALDARAFSLTGQNTPKPAYSRVTGVATLGGPLRIPHLLRNGPDVFVGYQWTRNRSASTESALVPTTEQRSGDFRQSPAPVFDPRTGVSFPDNVIPQDRISAQAASLLGLYPQPNIPGDGRYNYQVPLVGASHQDSLQSRLSQVFGSRNQVFGGFAFLSVRADNPSLFGFLDTSGTLGVTANANWSRRLGRGLFLNLGFQFSRYSSRTTPYFAHRRDISGDAGVAGNSRDPVDWGPPALTFSSGLAGLSDVVASLTRNQTSAVSGSLLWSRGRHNLTVGGDFRRQQLNFLSQQNPRGTFGFTGAAAGSALADFMLGVPDTAAIAFGNADKYFRDSVSDAYVNDDWRINPKLTLNAGLRWEYGSPIAERYGRLVNLDIAPGFAAVAPVVAARPQGALTGRSYPASLIRPDKRGFSPRVGIAWRPVSGSSLVIRAGYGIYRDTSVYPTLAAQMAQQSPLSKSLSVQNTAAHPLTLADAFTVSAAAIPNTYAVDPDFRIGSVRTWQLSVQRDLPVALQLTATYLGSHGTRGLQEFLPNTFPDGAPNPCLDCPAGYVYLTSNGNSSRHAAQVQLRRRLRSGFTATATYTFSKAIDDCAALGGAGPTGSAPSSPSGAAAPSPLVLAPAPSGRASIAQNWLNLAADRSLSNFDQRHLVTVQVQYTTGMGVAGGTLLTGWKGALFQDWTFITRITAGSGLPQNPTYPAPVNGTGVNGVLRPQYTGAPLYAAPAGLSLNPAAYSAPAAGQWGNAGRNSITGPGQFALNAAMARTFRVNDRLNLDLRVEAANALNHVTFTGWNTVVTGAQFGLPTAASAMRSMQTTLRLRF